MKYSVYGVVKGSKYLGEFEADSEEEAVKKALNSEAAYINLCWQCSDNCEDPEVVSAEAEEVTG